MCVQTRLRFILSPERVFGNGVRINVNSKEKILSTGGSEEDRTRDVASSGTASPIPTELFGPRGHTTYLAISQARLSQLPVEEIL